VLVVLGRGLVVTGLLGGLLGLGLRLGGLLGLGLGLRRGLVGLAPLDTGGGGHGDRAVLRGDEGLGGLVRVLALEQTALLHGGGGLQVEGGLAGLGVLGDGETDGGTVGDGVDGLAGLDVDQ